MSPAFSEGSRLKKKTKNLEPKPNQVNNKPNQHNCFWILCTLETLLISYELV